MDLSILIVSWNAKHYLEECLSSLTAACRDLLTEVIVVDNASVDGSPQLVRDKFPNLRLIQSKTNVGFARANNIGISQCSGKYIALINSDVRVLNNCLNSLVRYLNEHRDVGIVGPRVLNRDMTLQSSCRQFPSVWNNFCETVGLARLFRNSEMFSGEHMLYFAHDCEREVDVLVGCFWVIRREALFEVGWLDDGFTISAEDLDWCKRCWDSGWKVVFFPRAEAIHYRGGSSANDPARFAVEQQRAVLRYWSKHKRWTSCIAIRILLLSKHSARVTIAILNRIRRVPGGKNDYRSKCSRACIWALLTSEWMTKG
jgi:GT2 family glycosyltransferase